MKHLWLYWLPLLYLPDLGFETATPFGTLTVSDYFIGPYLILVLLAGQSTWSDRFNPRQKIYAHYLIPALLIFLWWASISTLTIMFRYDYVDLYPAYFSLLKLGKFTLYGVAAILTIRALSMADERDYLKFLRAIIASGILVGLTLLISHNSLENIRPYLTVSGQVFNANPTSVMLSIIIAFLVGVIVQGNSRGLWRLTIYLSLVIMVLGLSLAEGRGGWLSSIVAMVYLASRVSIKKTFWLTLVSITLVIFAYNQHPLFREQIDRTLYPDPNFIKQYDAGIFGINTIDAGARPRYWIVEASKIVYSPLLGTGFFHRGGLSGLDRVGSHNFLIQMFLETGIPGGVLVLIIIWKMWRHASSEPAKKSKRDLPVKAAIVAAIVSSISGEYFYGGMMLFTLLAVYASVGSLMVQQGDILQSSTPVRQIPQPIE